MAQSRSKVRIPYTFDRIDPHINPNYHFRGYSSILWQPNFTEGVRNFGHDKTDEWPLLGGGHTPGVRRGHKQSSDLAFGWSRFDSIYSITDPLIRYSGDSRFLWIQIEIFMFDRLFLQKVQNETYLSMINHTLNTPFFYFSYTYDLTHSCQRLSSVAPEFNEVRYA